MNNTSENKSVVMFEQAQSCGTQSIESFVSQNSSSLILLGRRPIDNDTD
jgi:hypothetical protein